MGKYDGLGRDALLALLEGGEKQAEQWRADAARLDWLDKNYDSLENLWRALGRSDASLSLRTAIDEEMVLLES